MSSTRSANRGLTKFLRKPESRTKVINGDFQLSVIDTQIPTSLHVKGNVVCGDNWSVYYMSVKGDLTVDGNIGNRESGEIGMVLRVGGNLNAEIISVSNLNARNINANRIYAGPINANNITANFIRAGAIKVKKVLKANVLSAHSITAQTLGVNEKITVPHE